MKSNIVLTSVVALLVSVVGANALEYRPFVGVSMGIQGAIYSSDTKDVERATNIDFPKDFFAFGVVTGVRAGKYEDIYNGGITLNATKSTYSKIQKKYVDTRVASADLFDISVTYDNYIRIDGDKANRIDLVLGAGMGATAYHIDPVSGNSETTWSFAPELKIGMDFELTKCVTLSAAFRALFPTNANHELNASYVAGGSVKYLF